MELTPRRFADAVVVRPTGRIDHAAAPAFRAGLAPHLERCAAGRDGVVLDFSGVDYISSDGLRVLVLAAKQARAQGGTLVITELAARVREIFEITRFEQVVEIVPTVREALARVSPAAAAAFAGEAGLRVHFWGTRGSIPVGMSGATVRDKIVAALVAAAGRGIDTLDAARAFVERELDFSVAQTFGGDSACVELLTGGPELVLCDLGSGARVFANHLLATRGGTGHTVNVFMSHLHWDHIMGFPFFMPAYLPGNRIRIYGCHAALEEAFRRQHAAPSFPVDFGRLGADIEFITLEPGRDYEIAGLRVRGKRQLHGGDSYGYRFEMGGKVVIYSTDSEHKRDDPAETDAFVEFFRDADLVIFDAMYSLAEAISVKEDWGHSSNIVGVELCQLARVKHLCLFHHEPINDDATIARILRETRRLEEITRRGRGLEVSAAYDGLEIAV
ncbi:MAG TPA: anti-sigma factor antagonist [Verrucomicrobiae bacterium]|jgi:anti-anti-sigma factor|nr:anti-sigma factor antagonist [Verrucomicrobiae bacterium]